MSHGRRLLIALLQITNARNVAARLRVYPQRVTDWATGHRVPCEQARRALERNYGIGSASWAKEYEGR